MQQDHVTIETPEHIQFSYELAGLGSRFLALFMDTLIQIMVLGLLWALVAYLASLTGVAEGFRASEIASIPLIPLIVLSSPVLFAIAYFMLFELIWRGQTPGKRLGGLRVIKVGGQQIGFTESALRNILRLIDFLPALYTIGILFVFFTSRCQRIGDLAAGTIVVKERLWELPARPASAAATDLDIEEELVRRARGYMAALTREEIEAVRRFIQRRGELSAPLRTRLAGDIAEPLYKKFPGLSGDERTHPELFLEVIYRAYLEQQQRM